MVKVRKKNRRPIENMIPTGCRLLNLAISDDINGGYQRGRIVNAIGDSHAGKTLMALNCLANLANDSRFKDYALIYDDVEGGCLFDIPHLFGERAAYRIEPPQIKEGEAAYSDTIQDFLQALDSLEGPYVYILDSLDALTTTQEQTKAKKTIKAARKGESTSGDYGLSKPKMLSQVLRLCKRKIQDTDSLIMIISQTRDDISMSFSKKTRAGGRALEFYSSHIYWLAHAGRLLKTVKGKKHTIGNETIINSTKTRITGKVRKVTIRSYYDYGVDDIESCILWLVDNGFWKKKSGGKISWPGSKQPESMRSIVEKVEASDKLMQALWKETQKAWDEIEDALKLKRTRRYSQ